MYIYIYIYIHEYKFAGPSAHQRVGICSGWSYGQRVLFSIGPEGPSSPETSRHRIPEVALATFWRSKALFLWILKSQVRVPRSLLLAAPLSVRAPRSARSGRPCTTVAPACVSASPSARHGRHALDVRAPRSLLLAPRRLQPCTTVRLARFFFSAVCAHRLTVVVYCFRDRAPRLPS